MTRPELCRTRLADLRNLGIDFEEAWQHALRGIRGEWRSILEWAKPEFRDAYHGEGRALRLSPEVRDAA